MFFRSSCGRLLTLLLLETQDQDILEIFGLSNQDDESVIVPISCTSTFFAFGVLRLYSKFASPATLPETYQSIYGRLCELSNLHGVNLPELVSPGLYDLENADSHHIFDHALFRCLFLSSHHLLSKQLILGGFCKCISKLK
jgi:hypothetical protein